MSIQVTKINPRLTIVTEQMPGLKSAAIGFFSATGSRYENEKQQGLTHLLEHMFFKGTENKSAKDISRIVESNGATIDGFTSKETTGIYFHCLLANIKPLFELFMEISNNLIFNEQELQKEKKVIIEEITEANENPQEYVYQLFMEIMFPNHPLSFPIAGTAETVNSFTQNDLSQGYQTNALKHNACISVAGDVDHEQILDFVATVNFQFISHYKTILPEKPPPTIERTTIFQQRPDLKQVYTIAGFSTISLKDKRRYALTVLNNILGGTESSRSVQILREQPGLLSSAMTFVDLYSDIGLWCIYHTSDIKNRERSLQVVFDQLAILKQNGITKEEFYRSVNHCRGMLSLGAESPSSRMMHNAQNTLLLGHPIPVAEHNTEYDKLNYSDVNSLVDMFEMERYSSATTGPIKFQDLGKIGVAPMKVIEKSENQ